MADETRVRRFEVKYEGFHPWFGTKADLLKLFRVAEECYAVQVHALQEVLDDPEYTGRATYIRMAGLADLSANLTVYEKDSQLTGPSENVLEEMDTRRIKRIVISGAEMTETWHTVETRMVIELTRGGVWLNVASDDAGWLNQTFGRLLDEIKRGRHPWWATWHSSFVRLIGWLLAIATAISVSLLVYFALEDRVIEQAHGPIALLAGLALLFGLAVWNWRIPLGEVLAEGAARPQYSSFLRFLLFGVLFSLAIGVLINLATG